MNIKAIEQDVLKYQNRKPIKWVKIQVFKSSLRNINDQRSFHASVKTMGPYSSTHAQISILPTHSNLFWCIIRLVFDYFGRVKSPLKLEDFCCHLRFVGP